MNFDGIAADLDPEELTRRVLTRCRELDFALAGVCDALPTSHEEHVRTWITGGRHGTMDYSPRRPTFQERLPSSWWRTDTTMAVEIESILPRPRADVSLVTPAAVTITRS
jgi:epoxyqueuosine reductase QueG